MTLRIAAIVAAATSAVAFAAPHPLRLVLVAQHPSPVLTTRSPGAEGIRFGFEGGRVVKVAGAYHLFTSEMVGDPIWVRMRLGHWTSTDREHWTRVATIRESSAEFTGADPRAAFAIDYFVYRVGLNAGMLAAALQGLDAFVFTAGIGENSVGIRARIAERLEWLGVLLDPAENARHASRISRADSQIPVYVVPTDEELMIAQHTLSLLWNKLSSSSSKRERAS
jgi:hypothetical protein